MEKNYNDLTSYDITKKGNHKYEVTTYHSTKKSRKQILALVKQEDKIVGFFPMYKVKSADDNSTALTITLPKGSAVLLNKNKVNSKKDSNSYRDTLTISSLETGIYDMEINIPYHAAITDTIDISKSQEYTPQDRQLMLSKDGKKLLYQKGEAAMNALYQDALVAALSEKTIQTFDSKDIATNTYGRLVKLIKRDNRIATHMKVSLTQPTDYESRFTDKKELSVHFTMPCTVSSVIREGKDMKEIKKKFQQEVTMVYKDSQWKIIEFSMPTSSFLYE